MNDYQLEPLKISLTSFLDSLDIDENIVNTKVYVFFTHSGNIVYLCDINTIGGFIGSVDKDRKDLNTSRSYLLIDYILNSYLLKYYFLFLI